MTERRWRPVTFALGLMAMLGCDPRGPTLTPPPGAEKRLVTTALESGATLLQSKPPVGAFHTYVDGFHFLNGNLDAQMEAHHYCSNVNEDLTQCVLFDANTAQARLIGIEYILSARLFAQLPAAEKRMWHSHVHEVTSGQLVAPGLPAAAEHALMKRLVGTYGKTWHLWHADGPALPAGIPQLMMGFTADGQLQPELLSARDARIDVNSETRRRQRADIPSPAIEEAADAWLRGDVIQLTDPTLPEQAALRAASATPVTQAEY